MISIYWALSKSLLLIAFYFDSSPESKPLNAWHKVHVTPWTFPLTSNELTGGIINVEEWCERIALRNQSVSYLTWISFISIFSMYMQNLSVEMK